MGQENHPLIQYSRFGVGDKVRHRHLDYRGVVLDIDSRFLLPETVLKQLSKETLSLKNLPWCHVLVHGTAKLTYVPETQLEADNSAEEMDHPALEICFETDAEGKYHRRLNLQ